MSEKKNVYVTMAFAGVALMVAMLVGVVVVRRRSARYPQHQVQLLILISYRVSLISYLKLV